MTFTTLFIQLALLVLPLVAKAEPHNVTVDDWDPSVTWAGSWSQTLPGFGRPYNGTYKTAKGDPNAYAEFKFKGVAVYFVSARWPYTVSTQLTLDPQSPDAKPLLLKLEDYNTTTIHRDFGLAKVLASATNLEYKEHTVRVDVGPNETYSVFDAFIYTTLDASDVTATSPPPSSSVPAFTALPEPELLAPGELPSQSTPTPIAAASKKPLNLAVIFGPICGVVAVCLVACAYFVYRFKKRAGTKRPQEDIYSRDLDKEKGSPSPSAVYEIDLPCAPSKH
ncbi:hypothetical protein NMY22_g10038 [Coprinellus aureogranulatus]|nr:hypothetical protein NMY22_g10038 [Coprinellus aureogranulatus]